MRRSHTHFALASLLALAALLLDAPAALAAQQPFIFTSSSELVTNSCATLAAGIYPEEAETTYHFEYLTKSQFETNEAEHKSGFEGAEIMPKPDAPVGSDNSPHHVSTEVCGLAPATAYEFRVVATNSQSPPGGTLGETTTFTTLRFGPSHRLTSSFGTAASGDPVPLAGPTDVAIDESGGPSTGDLYVTDPGIDERQRITIEATGGTFTLSFAGHTTEPLPYTEPPLNNEGVEAQVRQALESLPAIGPNNVSVASVGKAGTKIEVLEVTFIGTLSGAVLAQIEANGSALEGASPSATVTAAATGVPGSAVEKFNEKGEFLLIFGREVDKTKVKERKEGKTVSEASEDVCTAASGDQCGPGTPAPHTRFCLGGEANGGFPHCEEVTDVAPAQFEAPAYLALDNSPGGEGDLYVADPGTDLVQKFDSSGNLILSWGERGQQDGPTSTENGVGFYEQYFAAPFGIAVDPQGYLYVGAGIFGASNIVEVYTQAGAFYKTGENNEARYLTFFSKGGLSLHSDGAANIYSSGGAGVGILEFPRQHGGESQSDQFTTETTTTGFGLDPGEERPYPALYQDTGSFLFHYSAPDCKPKAAPCPPFDAFGQGQLAEGMGVAVAGHDHAVYVADAGKGRVDVFSDVRPAATTDPATESTETTLTLAGHLDTETFGEDHGPIAECFFEWGRTAAYGNVAPCEGTLPAHGEAQVTAKLEGLTPIDSLPVGTAYHYRLIAANSAGAAAQGLDQSARTTAPPQIEGVSSSHLSATSAQLDATIAPGGLPTTYYFEYGPTTAYGQTTAPAEITEGLFATPKVHVTIEGLQPGVAYHFRLLAENELDAGSPVASEDETFEFFPPSCPNSAVRQQTGSARLPDCRAYELVSPSNAGGTFLFSGGPNTATATSPSRFAFVGDFGQVPGTEPINTGGDLYIATRTDTGWQTHYIGLSGSEASCMGGSPLAASSYETDPPEFQNTVLTDPSMSHVLDWQDGEPKGCAATNNGGVSSDFPVDFPSNAPFLWNADGSPLGRLPTDLPTAPGALQSLACPHEEGSELEGVCKGEVTASADLHHLIFSSRNFDFTEGAQAGQGLTHTPGSAYDDNLQTGQITLISTLKNGQPIPQDPAFAHKSPGFGVPGPATEFLRFPAVSADGSHVLISTATNLLAIAPCGSAAKDTVFFRACPPYIYFPVHLYMSIDHGGAVEVSKSELTGEDVPVRYVGMTEDGRKVFFTSEEHLTAEDPDHGGASLYMWSEEGEKNGHPLTLISKGTEEGPGEPGDTAACDPAIVRKEVQTSPENEQTEEEEVPWTDRCSAVPYSSFPLSTAIGNLDGNGTFDSAIAQNGDVYFYSPEQLDGNRGVPGLPNLYDYRAGHLQFVATFNPEPYCQSSLEGEARKPCSAGPLLDINVNPTDTRMAFTTATRLTSYENQGHVEMYSYQPATQRLTCVSCNPSGAPATADVHAAQDGLFMAGDGRTFFSTTESLVPQDTNEVEDVYEYVDGRPQLVTRGTGTAAANVCATGICNGHVSTAALETPGLIGVSANGTDVYFSTYDVLTREDQNGDFLKFYDARTDGGFPQPPPAQPCAAAEECHGPGTEPPTLPQIASNGPPTTGGNANPHAHHGKKHKRAKHKRHGRRAHANRGGKK